MGQQQSSLKNQIKDKYTVIRTIAPGQYLVKGRRNGEQLQLRILSFLVEDQMTHYINLLEKRKKIKNSHLLELIQYNKVVDQLMCSSTFKLRIISEMPFKTIKDDIRERSTGFAKKYFAEDELWSILYSCCHALYSLYINKFSHESLTTEQIYIDTEGIIKVADNLLVNGTKNYLSLMNQNLKLDEVRYISPELRNLVDDNNFYQYDKQKSDVYIMGMIILQIANLSPLRYYEPKSKRFHFDVVRSAFSEFKQRYTAKLFEIIQKMLTPDYNIRPNFEEVIEGIQQKTFHTNSNTSSKDSSILNEGKKDQSANSKSNLVIDKKFQPPDFNTVKQRLDFNLKTTNSIFTQPQPQPQPQLQALQLNNYSKIDPLIPNNNYSSFPAPPYSKYINQPPPLAATSGIRSGETKQQNKIEWRFDTASKDFRYQNHHNYTPYQQLVNYSGNTSVPKNNFVFAKQEKIVAPPTPLLPKVNGSKPNVNKVEETPIVKLEQENLLRERRFSQLRFGGIELGLAHNSQTTQKKQSKPVMKGGSFTESKTMVSNQLFKKQKPEQEEIIEKGTFIIEENSNGRYQGFKQNNQKNGIGRIIYSDGGSYQGQWKNDKMDGYGKLFYPSGKIAYEGYWTEDEFNGAGRVFNEIDKFPLSKMTINYLNLSDIEDKWEYYEGEFNHDLRQGKGMIKFGTGEKFYGTFKDDVIDGEGTFYKNDGDVIHGTWKNNVFVAL